MAGADTRPFLRRAEPYAPGEAPHTKRSAIQWEEEVKRDAAESGEKKQAGLLRQFAGYYKPHWKLFAADMLCATLIAGVDLVFPMCPA